MKTKEELEVVQKEFFEIYNLLNGKKMFVEDKFSLGNLALFVDYYTNRYKWNEKKEKIKKFVLFNDRNELNMFLANELIECAKRLELSDNLKFKSEKIEIDYRLGKLGYFDIILDSYEFPDWFKGVGGYYPIFSKKDLYNKLLKALSKYPQMQNEELQIALTYYIDYTYKTGDLLKRLVELDGHIQSDNFNEVCWHLAVAIFSAYYPELKKEKNEQEITYSLRRLKELESLYKKKQLNTFNLFSELKLYKLKSKREEML